MAKESRKELEELRLISGLLLGIFRHQSQLILQLNRADSNVVGAIVQEMSTLSRQNAEASEDDTPRCSFCCKSEDEVQKLIAGPQAFICNECVVLCMDIVREDSAEDGSGD